MRYYLKQARKIVLLAKIVLIAKVATVQGAGLLAFSFWVHNNSICKSTASAKYYNNHTNHLFAQKIGIFDIGYAMTIMFYINSYA